MSVMSGMHPVGWPGTCTVAASAWDMEPVRNSISENGNTWSWNPNCKAREQSQETRGLSILTRVSRLAPYPVE